VTASHQFTSFQNTFQSQGKISLKYICTAGCWWLALVIPVTQEAEIRRITAGSQPEQIVCKTLSQKKKEKPSLKKRTGDMAQGEALSSNPSTKNKNLRWH
jgi:hypothetical protein